MKSKNFIQFLAALMLIVPLAACAKQPAAQPTPDTVLLDTAEPFIPTETEVVPTESAAVKPTATFTPTATIEPIATAETTISVVATEESAVSIMGSADVYITLAQNTICRTGPATTYPSVASISAGQRLHAAGRLNNNNIYYYIENPAAPKTYCWVYGEGASVEGNRAELEIIQPLPSPTPDSNMGFAFTYENVVLCGDDYAFNIRVENTDKLPWQSIKVVITDVVNGIMGIYKKDRFEESVNCTLDNFQGDLAEDEHAFITLNNPGHFDYRPWGRYFTIRVTLCSGKGLSGACLTKQIKVKP